MTSFIVRGGIDHKHPRNQHTMLNVVGEMFLQVIRDYAGINDFRTLTVQEIKYLYEGLRPELKEITKPKGK